MHRINQNPKTLRYVCVGAHEVIAARQFYGRAINAVAGHRPTRANGYENWAGGTWSDSFDSFAAGLREIGKLHSGVSETKQPHSDIVDATETSYQQHAARSDSDCNLILVVENANYLTGPLKELPVPLIRLSEMAPNAAVVFIADVRWDDIRESARACPDPYLIKVPALSREDTLLYLASHFPTPIVVKPAIESPKDLPPLTAAHDDLLPLRRHFLSAVYDICSPHSLDPNEVAYVASAAWPAFVAPILADWESIRAKQLSSDDMELDQDAEIDVDDTSTWGLQGPGEVLTAWRRSDTVEYPLPTEVTRLRLIRYLSPSILAAFHELHPRQTSARAWAKAHVPPPSFRASVWTSYPQISSDASKAERLQLKQNMSLHTQMLILACYLAGYNPTKSDMRIFGRDASGIPKRKNRGYAKGKGKVSAAKVPQKLLGSVAFSLERMLVVLEALTLEYVDFPGIDDTHQREDTANLETNRARTMSELARLVQERRVVRTGSADSIGCNNSYKCNIGFNEVDEIATRLRMPLHEPVWDLENQ